MSDKRKKKIRLPKPNIGQFNEFPVQVANACLVPGVFDGWEFTLIDSNADETPVSIKLIHGRPYLKCSWTKQVFAAEVAVGCMIHEVEKEINFMLPQLDKYGMPLLLDMMF